MKSLIKLVRLVNRYTVWVVLAFFYLVAIGGGSLIRILFRHPHARAASYWQSCGNELVDLSSPY